MSRMEAAVDALAGSDAEKAFKDMLYACNTFGLDVTGFLELIRRNPRTVKIWTKISWYWIARLSDAYHANRYDQRNEQSCYIGNLLQQAIDEKFEPLPELPRDDFTSIFVNGIAYDHRTNQQSFTNLVFAWIKYLAEEKNVRKAKYSVKKILEVRSEFWYRMPMI